MRATPESENPERQATAESYPPKNEDGVPGICHAERRAFHEAIDSSDTLNGRDFLIRRSTYSLAERASIGDICGLSSTNLSARCSTSLTPSRLATNKAVASLSSSATPLSVNSSDTN